MALPPCPPVPNNTSGMAVGPQNRAPICVYTGSTLHCMQRARNMCSLVPRLSTFHREGRREGGREEGGGEGGREGGRKGGGGGREEGRGEREEGREEGREGGCTGTVGQEAAGAILYLQAKDAYPRHKCPLEHSSDFSHLQRSLISSYSDLFLSLGTRQVFRRTRARTSRSRGKVNWTRSQTFLELGTRLKVATKLCDR